MTEREKQAARSIARFLRDEHVAETFRRLEGQAVDDWKGAETPDAREAAWHRVRALEALQRELAGIVERGEFAGALD